MERTPADPAELTAFLGVPADAAWDPFLFEVVEETPLQARATFRDLGLGIYLSGRTRIRRQIGAQVVEGWTDRGAINITAPGVEATWETNASARAAVVVVRSEFLSRAIEEHWGVDARKCEIANQFLIRDPLVEAVVLALARDELNQSPSYSLYADSGCEFLAHHLIHRYSNLSPQPPRSVGGLSSRSLKRVLDYIEDRLDQPISLRDLAALADVSSRHFERAFRQSTGSSPHAYVMERRIDVGREMLVHRPEAPIEAIGLKLGFCSSSHFSSAFRRRVGVTPTEFRKTWSQ